MQGHSGKGRSLIPHVGAVRMGKNVAVQTGAVVVRSFFRRPTTVGTRSVIGIGTVVGHGAFVGDGVVIAGGVTVGGRARIDDHSFIPMKVTILPNAVVTLDTTLSAGSTFPSRLTRGRDLGA